MKRLLPSLLLVGCVSVEPKVEPVKLDKVIPPKPSPVQTYNVTWNATDNPGMLMISVEDGVKVNSERKDTLRYIKDLQNLVCYYENSYSFCNQGENLDE